LKSLGIATLLTLLAAVAVAEDRYFVPEYDISLASVSVRVPGKQIVRHFGSPLPLLDPNTGNPIDSAVVGLRFSDESLSVQWSVEKTAIAFDLKNNSEVPLAILWNKASYVSPDGRAHPVFHQGIRYADRMADKAPSVVPGGDRLSDVVAPADFVRYENGWRTEPLLPQTLPSSSEARKAKNDLLLGTSFKVFLPVAFDLAVHEYTFEFVILWIDDKEVSWDEFVSRLKKN